MPTKAWKFVDKIAASPTVTFDMNRADGSVALDFGEGFNISPPPKKRSFTTNSITDGGLLTSSAYENRVLEFTVAIDGTYSQKVAQCAALKEQLGKDQNLIMYTPKAGTI